MKIYIEDYKQIQKHLENERWAGNEYVVFPQNTPIRKEDIGLHHTEDHAIAESRELSTNSERYNYMPIRPAYRAMAEAYKNPEYVVQKNGVVDVLAMVNNRAERQEQAALIEEQKSSTMNQKNYDYLKDNIKFLGFGENHTEKLAKNMKEGKDNFTLTVDTEVSGKRFEAELRFQKPKDSDMYFLNNYKASLERNDGQKVEQTFFLDRGKGVTAKEAFNLLDGRSVYKELANKEGQKYNSWLQLDLNKKDDKGNVIKDKYDNHSVSQFHDKYGYDLKSAVNKYNITEMDGGEKEGKLLQSLRKGNLHSVTMDNGKAGIKTFVEANPQYKTINVYDEKMKLMKKEDLAPYLNPAFKQEIKQSDNNGQPAEKQSQKESSRQNKKKDDEEGPGNKQQRKQNRGRGGDGDDEAPDMPKQTKGKRNRINT